MVVAGHCGPPSDVLCVVMIPPPAQAHRPHPGTPAPATGRSYTRAHAPVSPDSRPSNHESVLALSAQLYSDSSHWRAPGCPGSSHGGGAESAGALQESWTPPCYNYIMILLYILPLRISIVRDFLLLLY